MAANHKLGRLDWGRLTRQLYHIGFAQDTQSALGSAPFAVYRWLEHLSADCIVQTSSTLQ